MELTESLKALFTTTAAALKGAARRVFMARSVQELGRGGQSVEARLPGLGKWFVDVRHTSAKPSTG